VHPSRAASVVAVLIGTGLLATSGHTSLAGTVPAAVAAAVADSTATISKTPAMMASDTTTAHRPHPVEVRGVVQDANGGPVRGATIRLTSETDTLLIHSDGAGRFHATLTASRGVSLLVQAYGYRDLVRSYRAYGRPIDAALALPPPYPLGWVTVVIVTPPREEQVPPGAASPSRNPRLS